MESRFYLGELVFYSFICTVAPSELHGKEKWYCVCDCVPAVSYLIILLDNGDRRFYLVYPLNLCSPWTAPNLLQFRAKQYNSVRVSGVYMYETLRKDRLIDSLKK